MVFEIWHSLQLNQTSVALCHFNLISTPPDYKDKKKIQNDYISIYLSICWLKKNSGMYLHVRGYHLKIDWFLVCNIFFELYLLHFLQFALLETSSVDDDLANLKKELSGSSKVCLRQPLYHFLNDPSLAQKEDRKHFMGNNRSYTSAKGYNSPQKEIPILVNQEKWRKTSWFWIFMICCCSVNSVSAPR